MLLCFSVTALPMLVLWCYTEAVKLILLYAIGLQCYCVFDVTISCNVTLLLIYQCYCILLCFLTWLLMLLYGIQPYLFTVLLMLLYATIVTCSYDTRVNIWYSVTLLLCYKCYYILLCYRVTKYGIASCYCVINVTICCSVTVLP